MRRRLTLGVDGTYELFLEHHMEFVTRLLALTRRPTGAVIRDAVMSMCEPCSPGVAIGFANMVCEAVSHCRNVAKSVHSGRKLSACIRRVAQMLARPKKAATPGLKQTARRLLKRNSTASDEVVMSRKARACSDDFVVVVEGASQSSPCG